ncbi:MAG: AAA family ATPase [candidate division KSB1 bacterium]|nr:AAA family ATPase [candidate division KSB1 bacterium]MDZ7300457.1 AAA family ATPase [candidate division KSB1 bacterium]MDZ7308635.1 AAA family ATPase [candidate division KSB1 bacterium]MDZ7351441.1 AAA family ATPase [candidate division KSB1 bacterium]MDZ7355800.1 AAA family ATPase [candidate division KSB1 bacterium]
MTSDHAPRWVREIDRYLGIKTQFYLHGNVHDRVCDFSATASPQASLRMLTLRQYLLKFFRERGYELIGFFDPLDGLCFPDELGEPEVKMQQTFLSLLPKEEVTAAGAGGRDALQRFRPTTTGYIHHTIAAARALMRNSLHGSVLIFEHASRLLATPQQLQDHERLYFLGLLKCALEATVAQGKSNLTLLICDKLNDLPAWLYLNNPRGRSVHIDFPDEDERRAFLAATERLFYKEEGKAFNLKETLAAFVDFTQGLSNSELFSLRTLSHREKLPLHKPREIVERYKFGKIESKWNKLDPARLNDAPKILGERVLGQEEAINAVTDILKRAKLGLSGIQHSARSNKPKGILFFAGPTGVGKTEMAKGLAELLFHDERACIRFDMSEYSQQHSDQKLLGAPPGYVGYEEGGQLTNKVKENPFCVLLFDEIEKADRNILDKFLQILEDGRMTDGRGETVYFSETLIIFTSNLGTVEELPGGERKALTDPGMKPEDVKGKILAAIENHFKYKLGRPEIFNRFGNNFVVFNYIKPEVMAQIIKKILGQIVKDARERLHLELDFAPAVIQHLHDAAVQNLEMGGRGAGNLIETVIVNPLARRLFDYGEKLPNRLGITGIHQNQHGQYELECSA